MLSNVRIGARVLLLIAMQCALLIIGGFTGLSGRAQSSGHAQGVYEKSIVPLLHLDHVLDRNVQMRARIEQALGVERASNHERLTEQLQGLNADAEKAWKEYAATPMNDEERKLAAQTMQAHEAMMAAEQQLITTLRTQGRAAAIELERRGEWARKFDQWRQTLDQLVEYQARDAQADSKSADARYGHTHSTHLDALSGQLRETVDSSRL